MAQKDTHTHTHTYIYIYTERERERERERLKVVTCYNLYCLNFHGFAKWPKALGRKTLGNFFVNWAFKETSKKARKKRNKIIEKERSAVFKQTCIFNDWHPKYTRLKHTHKYIYIYIYIYVKDMVWWSHKREIDSH